MQPAAIVCANCGWRNEPSAMMCGGCGLPLLGVSSRMAQGRQTVDLEDTLPDIPTFAPRIAPAPTYPAPRPSQPQAPQTVTRRRRGRRLLTGCLVTLAVLLVGAIGLWVVIIRPVAHNIVDSQLRDALEIATTQAPTYPPGTLTVTEEQLDQRLGEHNFGRLPIRRIAAQFRDGSAGVTYSLPITGGSVRTRLVVREGKLVAQDTHVEGLAGLIESGDELQATLNEALALLPAGDHFGSVTSQNGTLSVTILNK